MADDPSFAGFKPLPTSTAPARATFRAAGGAPLAPKRPLTTFSYHRNLNDKQFGNVQVPTPERRTTPAGQFSAWGAGGE